MMIGHITNFNTGILSSNLRYIESLGWCHLAILEFPPQVFTFSWYNKIEKDWVGYKNFQYRKVKIAFPYLIITIPILSSKNEIGTPIFYSSQPQLLFSNDPLTSRKFKASPAPLLNCIDPFFIHSLNTYDYRAKAERKPLNPTDIHNRTYSLKDKNVIFPACLIRNFATTLNPNPPSIKEAINAAIINLLYGDFNSDYDEKLTNFFVYRKPELYPIENWETNTQKNPNFIMDIDWNAMEFTF